MAMASPTKRRRRDRGDGSGSPAALTPGRWVRIFVVLGLSLLVAAHAGLTAFAEIARTRSPALAVRFTSDPLASVHLLENELRTAPNRIGSERTASVARGALRGQAIGSAPFRMLALHYAARREPERARAFAAFSERLSRRDLMT